MRRRFVWTERNTRKIEAHGLTRETVEATFAAADASGGDDRTIGRFILEGTVTGRFLRVIYAASSPNEVFVITAYRVSPRRRRT